MLEVEVGAVGRTAGSLGGGERDCDDAGARQTRPHLSLEKNAPEPRPIQLPEWEEWLQYPKLVDCTTATNLLIANRFAGF